MLTTDLLNQKPLPSTPSSPPYSVHVQENLSLAVVSAENSHEEDGTRNSTHLEEKETPRKRGRPGKVLKKNFFLVIYNKNSHNY